MFQMGSNEQKNHSDTDLGGINRTDLQSRKLIYRERESRSEASRKRDLKKILQRTLNYTNISYSGKLDLYVDSLSPQ